MGLYKDKTSTNPLIYCKTQILIFFCFVFKTHTFSVKSVMYVFAFTTIFQLSLKLKSYGKNGAVLFVTCNTYISIVKFRKVFAN